MQQIYISKNGQQHGPYTLQDLDEMLQSESITGEDFYWHEGADSWRPVSQLHGFVPPPSSVRPPPPPPRTTPAAPPSQPQPSTAKKTNGCLIAFLIVAGFGVLVIGCSIFLAVIGSNSIKKEWSEKKLAILNQVKKAADAGDDARVIELASKFRSVNDPELDVYLHSAHAAVNAAKEKERSEKAAKARADAIAKAAREKQEMANAPPQPPKSDAKPTQTHPAGESVTIHDSKRVVTDSLDTVQTVKGGVLDMDKSTTLGQAFDDYRHFTAKVWTPITAANGRKLVEAAGTINFATLTAKDFAAATAAATGVPPELAAADANTLSQGATALRNVQKALKGAQVVFQFVLNLDDTFQLKGGKINLVLADNRVMPVPMSEEEAPAALKDIYEGNLPVQVVAVLLMSSIEDSSASSPQSGPSTTTPEK